MVVAGFTSICLSAETAFSILDSPGARSGLLRMKFFLAQSFTVPSGLVGVIDASMGATGQARGPRASLCPHLPMFPSSSVPSVGKTNLGHHTVEKVQCV